MKHHASGANTRTGQTYPRSTDVPVKLGDICTVEALRLNDDGDGVASVDGFTVFVPGLLPGERGEIEVTQVERRFARARLRSLLPEQRAADRTNPACAVYGACGGCQLQHLSYEAQLAHKRRVVEQALARIGRITDVPVRPTIGVARPWRYRNHIQVPLVFDPVSGRYEPGFFATGSHHIVRTRKCHLAPEALERLVQEAVDALNDTPEATLRRPPAGAHFAETGAVHHLIARQSHSTGEQMLVFVVTSEAVRLEEVVRRLMDRPQLVGIARTVQPRPHGPVWGHTVEVLWGCGHLSERLLGLEFLISPRSFFQVNTAQAAVLYEQALAYADLRSGDRVLDAYCGTGTLTLLAAARLGGGHALGIENVPAAVSDARANAAHNGITNAEFVVGDVEQVLPQRVRDGERFGVVLLDPPRRGCEPEVIHAIAAARPRRIVYVSCNPATFARDARRLVDAGYRLEEVQPVDMFPQTGHVECCSLFVTSGE